MLEKYEENFGKLPVKQAAIVSGALTRRVKGYVVPKRITGATLYAACRDAKLDQAAIVTALAGESGPDAEAAMETITGKKMQKKKIAPAKKGGKATTKRNVVLSDPRILTAVVPNPKRDGTKAHARYENYRVGMSVDQAIAAGVLRADVAWDLERKFIELAQPDEPAAVKAVKAYEAALKKA